MSVNYTSMLFYGIAIPKDLCELPDTDLVTVVYTGNAWGGEDQYYAAFKDSLEQIRDDNKTKSVSAKIKQLNTREMNKIIISFLQNYDGFDKKGDWLLALVIS